VHRWKFLLGARQEHQRVVGVKERGDLKTRRRKGRKKEVMKKRESKSAKRTRRRRIKMLVSCFLRWDGPSHHHRTDFLVDDPPKNKRSHFIWDGIVLPRV
jgi:hypothetical protein